MTSAIWRISAGLNIPLYPELAVKLANEDANLTSIVVISTINKHVKVKNSTLVFMSSTFMLSIEILISTFFSLLPFTPTSLFLIWFANCQKRKKFKTMLNKRSCINGVVIIISLNVTILLSKLPKKHDWNKCCNVVVFWILSQNQSKNLHLQNTHQLTNTPGILPGNDYVIILRWFAENLKCQFLCIRNLTY